jgi:glycosyltransferase involved in cell wall biosynthesis
MNFTLKPQMKILYIINGNSISGAEVVLVRLINELREYIKPVVVCQNDGPLEGYLRESGLSVLASDIPTFTKTLNPIKLISYIVKSLKLKSKLEKVISDIDIIHCNSLRAVLAIMPILIKLKIPCVWHNHDILRPTFLNQVLVRMASWKASRIICVSNAVKINTIKLGVSSKKINVIYNGLGNNIIQNSSVQDRFRKKFNINENFKLVGMLGPITEWKGQHVLIEAAPLVIKQFKHVQFIIAGGVIAQRDLEYKKRITKLIKKHRLEKNVLLVGFQKDQFAVISDTDIIVHCSIREDPLPTVILEAMALEKPVVGSNVGGVPELIQDGVNGILIPPNSPEKLAKAILTLLRELKVATEMGRRGKKIAGQKFKIEEQAKKVRDIYLELLRNQEIE